MIAGLADSPTRTGAEDDIVWEMRKHDADNAGTRTIRGRFEGRFENDLERFEDDLGRFEDDLGRLEND